MKLRVFCFILFVLYFGRDSFGQTKFGAIKIAFMGNSYCNGGGVPVVGDERPQAYRYLVRQRFAQFYNTVTEVKLCLGGEDITDGMPDWYPGTIPSRNIDTALRSNADLILIEYAGNHFADKVKYDTIKWCYQYIADTLQDLSKRFIFTSSMPRKTAFDSPLTYVQYQDTAMQFNTWLYANYPLNNVNVFDNLYDGTINKPVFSYLGSDSLHWNATGYAIIAEDIFEGNAIIDTLIGMEIPRMYNIRLTEVGDSVDITGYIRSKQVKVYSSTDGIDFNQIYSGSYIYQSAIRVEGFPYIKLVAISNNKTVTLTKHFL